MDGRTDNRASMYVWPDRHCCVETGFIRLTLGGVNLMNQRYGATMG